jgi:hypothetical protein
MMLCRSKFKATSDYIRFISIALARAEPIRLAVRDLNVMHDKWQDNFNEVLHNLEDIVQSGK